MIAVDREVLRADLYDLDLRHVPRAGLRAIVSRSTWAASWSVRDPGAWPPEALIVEGVELVSTGLDYLRAGAYELTWSRSPTRPEGVYHPEPHPRWRDDPEERAVAERLAGRIEDLRQIALGVCSDDSAVVGILLPVGWPLDHALPISRAEWVQEADVLVRIGADGPVVALRDTIYRMDIGDAIRDALAGDDTHLRSAYRLLCRTRGADTDEGER